MGFFFREFWCLRIIFLFLPNISSKKTLFPSNTNLSTPIKDHISNSKIKSQLLDEYDALSVIDFNERVENDMVNQMQYDIQEIYKSAGLHKKLIESTEKENAAKEKRKSKIHNNDPFPPPHDGSEIDPISANTAATWQNILSKDLAKMKLSDAAAKDLQKYCSLTSQEGAQFDQEIANNEQMWQEIDKTLTDVCQFASLETQNLIDKKMQEEESERLDRQARAAFQREENISETIGKTLGTTTAQEKKYRNTKDKNEKFEMDILEKIVNKKKKRTLDFSKLKDIDRQYIAEAIKSISANDPITKEHPDPEFEAVFKKYYSTFVEAQNNNNVAENKKAEDSTPNPIDNPDSFDWDNITKCKSAREIFENQTKQLLKEQHLENKRKGLRSSPERGESVASNNSMKSFYSDFEVSNFDSDTLGEFRTIMNKVDQPPDAKVFKVGGWLKLWDFYVKQINAFFPYPKAKPLLLATSKTFAPK